MDKVGKILVTGGGGFIGGHLVADLLRTGHSDIRVVDCKPLTRWYQVFPQVENVRDDLRKLDACRAAVRGARYVFNLAADMGGMGFIETHKAECMLSVLISTHMLMAAREASADRFFYSSSACVYSAEKQTSADVVPLRESDAYPATPEDGYGWEKLFSERMCRHLREDYVLTTRVARYHNVYGPNGTYDGGREKAPAAICRKVIAAKLSGSRQIEIWGDSNQTRSFMYIDDCITGTRMILDSDETEPLNLGSDRLVTINQLVNIVEAIGGVKLRRIYNPSAPKGVRGRNSDNTLIKERLRWAPAISLEVGLEQTYRWIYDQMAGGVEKGVIMVSGRAPLLNVLCVQVSASNIATAIDEIDRWIREGYRSYATLTGVHGIMESVRNEEIRRAHDASGLVLPDGMPLVWLLWHGGFAFADRVYGPDLMLALFSRSEQSGYRHFLYGGIPRTIECLKKNLVQRFPAAKIVGAHAPPFRPAGAAEDEAVIEAINASAPDIVWVGLSTPKQELWMARHRDRLAAPVLIGVGAAFDFHAGLVRQAPRLVQRMGLEWAFRVAMEPRRLATRYLRNNPTFLALLAAEKLGLRRLGKVEPPSTHLS